MESMQSGTSEYFAQSDSIKNLRLKGTAGCYLFDEEGRRYIDFTSGWCVGNLGWNHPSTEEALRAFEGPGYVSPHFEYAPWAKLSDLLVSMLPGKLEKCFRATGGTEAVEIALQAARAFTGREEFIAIEGAYHGNSLATRALVSGPAFFPVKRLRPPLIKESLDELEAILRSRKVAGLIMEPILMNLDVQIPEREFMLGMQDLCRKYGTLVIMDEVATGFGRTGKLFASEYFELRPDIICLAKALSGGAAAIGATVTRLDVGDALTDEGLPYSTFGWHPRSVAATIGNLEFFQKNWPGIEANIRSVGTYFRQRLEGMNFIQRPEIRIMGMAMVVKLGDRYGKEIVDRAFRRGLIIEEGLNLLPPLNLDLEMARAGLDILEDCL